jgi:DNA modification methylase
MRTLLLEELIVPTNRQRTEVSDDYIGELMGALFSEDGAGIINPITVRDGNTLVAGECRSKAIRLGYTLGKRLRHAGEVLPEGHIPVIDFGDLTPLQRMEVEYAENARRKDLDWKDNIRAIAMLDALRKAQKAEVGQTHTFKETAKELFKVDTGIHADNVSKAVTIAAKLAGNKELAGAKSFNEAKKILAKQETTAHNARLAETVGRTVTSDRMQVHHADCLVWMKEQPGEQFDVILTDPPYGMDADGFGDGAGRMAGTTHQYADGKDATQLLLSAAIPEFYRLAKPESHLYLWCDIDLFHWLRAECAKAGWEVHRTPLINVKPEGGRVAWAGSETQAPYGPRRCYEICLYAVKGKRPVTKIYPDVFESRLVEGNFGHGAQKPVEAYVNLLQRSVRPGDKVFDAFAGTGTIFPAAAAVGCYAVGVEQEAAAYGICVNRIKELE